MCQVFPFLVGKWFGQFHLVMFDFFGHGRNKTRPSFKHEKFATSCNQTQPILNARPNIENLVGIVARFQDNPKEDHYKVVKRIFKYLKGEPDLGLWYPRESDFRLTGYSDSDLAGSVEDRKSTFR